MPFLQEYTMLDELGKGGFATVYKVRHNELGYIRAIRVLNETIVDASSPTYQKFLRECKVLLRLGNGSHPNIVHIYQPRLLENKALVEMDYVDGQDIMHYLKQNQNFVPVEEVVRMALQMSSALAYCHEDIYRFCMDREVDNLRDDPDDGSKVLMDEKIRQRLIAKYKIIHNDIHSGNIMRREDGNFVLLDFGLAINGEEVVRSSRHANGAPEFKAPEKWDDESILTEQSDIYSFGVVMFEYLAGRVPFPYDKKISNKTEAEYLLNKAHKNVLPPPIEDLRRVVFERNNEGKKYTKDYPQWLEDVILKCLQKNPADRFKNGKELFGAVTAGIKQTTNSETDFLKQSVDKLKQERDNLQQRLRQQGDNLQNAQNELHKQSVALEEERKHLREEWAGLQSQKEELEAARKDLSAKQDDVNKQKEALDAELKRLRKEQKKSPAIVWKVLCGVLLLILLAGGGYFWHFANINSPGHDTQDLTAELEEKNYAIDSLQQVLGQLQVENNDLKKALKVSNDNNGKSKTIEANSTYNGYDAEHWYKKYIDETKQISVYQGHDAEYWYNQYSKKSSNSTYQGHDAKYWYDQYSQNNSSSFYQGHDAKYWYDNRLYNGHDAKYWYDNRLYGGHDAKYWYDHTLYEGHDARHWYNKYMDKLKIK